MADTKLKQVGPDSGQLSTKLSFLEKTQIGAIRNTGHALGVNPGVITSSVSKAVGKMNNTARSELDLGSSLAAKLEQAGSVRKNSRDFITTYIPGEVKDRLALHDVPSGTRDDSFRGVPYRTEARKKSVDDVIRKNKGDIAGGVLEKLGFSRGAGLQFPADLDTQAPTYLTLAFAAYNRKDPFAPGTMGSATEIHLPLPENFSFSSNIKLQESDTGIYGELLNSQAGQAAISQIQNGKFTAAVGEITSAMSNATASEVGANLKNVAMRAAFAGLEGVDPVVGGLAGQIKGAVPNPHPTVFMKGIELRQFQWNWKLVPRNQTDADMISAIIKVVRSLVIPQASGDGSWLEYPHMVKPRVIGGDKDLYGKFKNAMVSQFTVNYSAEGSSAFFVNGAPVAINLGLNFQETENYDGS